MKQRVVLVNSQDRQAGIQAPPFPVSGTYLYILHILYIYIYGRPPPYIYIYMIHDYGHHWNSKPPTQTIH